MVSRAVLNLACVPSLISRPGLGAAHVQVAMVGSLIAPAMDFHFDLLRQFAAQVFHMHAGSAVDIGRVFARH